jgi:WhiB family transcriptional regulator, redox-sensing transcriptional regulator
MWNHHGLKSVNVSRQALKPDPTCGRSTRTPVPGGTGIEGRDDVWAGDMQIKQADWRVNALCRDEDPDGLFVRGKEQRKAKLVCLACPVRTECLAEALDNRIEFGVWGGMTERERRALLRRRPDVLSWRELLENARRSHTDVDVRVG